MRVVTLVLSTSEGSNARLVFTDPEDNDREVISVNTNQNCMHIQNFGCQSHLRHQVIAAAPSIGKIGDDGDDNGVRLVFSFRYSIDHRDHDLMSALIHDDEKLRASGRRGDYNISQVVNALEKGFRPTPAIDIAFGNSVSHYKSSKKQHSKVDPSRLLVDGGIGRDKSSCLPPDTIPADQQSIRDTTSGYSFDYKDVQQLWQRVTSGPFLLHLNRHKIRVRTEYYVTYKNQDGRSEKRGRARYLARHHGYLCSGLINMQITRRQKRDWTLVMCCLNLLFGSIVGSHVMNTQVPRGVVSTTV